MISNSDKTLRCNLCNIAPELRPTGYKGFTGKDPKAFCPVCKCSYWQVPAAIDAESGKVLGWTLSHKHPKRFSSEDLAEHRESARYWWELHNAGVISKHPEHDNRKPKDKFDAADIVNN